MTPDRIEKSVTLRAPLERVWKAVSDSAQFGHWFGVEFDAPFEAGAKLIGRIVPTKVDPEVAKLQEPHKGKAFEFDVDQIEPMKRISFRWRPFAIDPNHDYSNEEKTLIVFELKPLPDGVLLTITESGFDKIPLQRRAQAFKANEAGWAHQAALIGKYVERSDAA